MIKSKFILLFVFGLLLITDVSAQHFTHADTLRGSVGPGRDWWKALKYDIHVTFNIPDSTIKGFNVVYFKALKNARTMQIDLKEPLTIDSIFLVAYIPLKFDTGLPERINSPKQRITSIKREGNAYFIEFPFSFQISSTHNLIVYYHGKPHVPVRPPWGEGGVVWSKDAGGNPWITVTCEGSGASGWFPCKDYLGDKPDSAALHITAPSDLVSIGNGRLRSVRDNKNGTSTSYWAVTSPINTYCIIPYIGKYVNFSEVYAGEKGNLDMSYWVLDQDLEKAKAQFKQAPMMMKAFESWLGPYPFYNDGYKLVESSHLGMEHQSAVAYGNHFMNGYLGHDLSGTGWGLKWDYIIVHESGHEWFGNNISVKDQADMWVHEGMTTYTEVIYTEYYFGKEAGNDYAQGLRKGIRNKENVIGHYGVNADGSGDMYPKGANMIHTIRQIINNDEKFKAILRGLGKTYYHSTVTTAQIENYISKEAGIDFSKVFDQYLRTIKIPVLEYKISNGMLSYKWTNVVNGFNLPLKIMLSKENYTMLYPTEKVKQIKTSLTDFAYDHNYYISTSPMK
ncbi:MAG: M1 family metallopeptidase [Ginsengibacter sp.]